MNPAAQALSDLIARGEMPRILAVLGVTSVSVCAWARGASTPAPRSRRLLAERFGIAADLWPAARSSRAKTLAAVDDIARAEMFTRTEIAAALPQHSRTAIDRAIAVLLDRGALVDEGGVYRRTP